MEKFETKVSTRMNAKRGRREMKDKNHDTSNCISLMKRIKDVPVIEEKREKSGGGRGVWKVDV